MRDCGSTVILFNSLIPRLMPRRAATSHSARPRIYPSALQQFFFDHDKAVNSSFLILKKLLESSAGDFRGFQEAFEEIERGEKGDHIQYCISNWCVASGCTQLRALDRGRVSDAFVATCLELGADFVV